MSFYMIALCGLLGQGAESNLATELPRLAPTEAASALSTFQIHAGFKLVQAAAEPAIVDPVAACFDADQRLYVVEMGDYPFRRNAPNGRVKLLEDRDRDGLYETSTVFLDKLAWPTSILPYKGGVLVAAAPDILYAVDRDGDGVADETAVVLTGFGIENVQALVNGLIWGLDGWVYGASGGNGGEITSPLHPDVKPLHVRGRDFRFRPDGSALEAVTGGGQFGHAFDNWGNRFTCNNSNHIRQVVIENEYLERNPSVPHPRALLDIAVEGPAARVYRISPAEPWRLVRTRQRAADPAMVQRLPPTELVPIGYFTSATGITIYRGTAFGPEYTENAFIGDVGGNLVHRKRLDRGGPAFRAARADEGTEFLASTDNWFRPVTFINTPDGTLLLLDMYREAIEHPDSIPDAIKRHLDLTSGTNRGRLYAIVPEQFRKRPRLSLSRATTSELVSLLGDSDSYWRETAQRLLVERPERDTVPLLRAFLISAEQPLATLHALWTLANLGALRLEDLAPALHSAEPWLRVNAARLLEQFDSNDRETLEPLIALARDADSNVRFQAALSLGRRTDGAAFDALCGIARQDLSDPYARTAVLLAMRGRTPQLLVRALEEQWSLRPGGLPWLELLGELAAQEATPEELSAIAALASGGQPDQPPAGAALQGLARGLNRQNRRLFDAVGEAGAHALRKAGESAIANLRDDRTDAERIDAVISIALLMPERAADVLPDLITPRQSLELQRAAIRALSTLDASWVSETLLKHWPDLSPAARSDVIDALLSRANWSAQLLDSIETGAVSAAELQASQRARLRQHSDELLRERALRVLSPGGIAKADVEAIVADASALRGEKERGRGLVRQHCFPCHRVLNEGHQVGPDLVTVAARSTTDLLTHIVDPNREVNPAYVVYAVAAAGGRTFSGIIAEESGPAITLRSANGESERLLRTEIEEIRSTGVSLMPDDLSRQLDPQSLADVVSFIQSLAEQNH